jgi:hypothetical protein
MKVNYKITPREAFDRGIWDKLCEVVGLSEWCVNDRY